MSRSLEQLRLTSDDLEVVVLPEVGARLHRIRAFGHDLLRTPDDPAAHHADPFFWGAYPMAPWCNRARPGRRVVAGREVDLRPNFPDGSAIHGLVSSAPWRVVRDGRLEIDVADGAWPWAFTVSLDVTVDGRELVLRYALHNRSDGPMPAGLGLHPWVRAPVEVAVPAASVYAANTESPAVASPVHGRLDLRPLGPPAADLDATWTDLAPSAIELRWLDTGLAARLSTSTSARPLVALASPSAVGAVAIEPQTHGPDPLRRLERGEPDAPALLAPGGVLSLDVRLETSLARNLR